MKKTATTTKRLVFLEIFFSILFHYSGKRCIFAHIKYHSIMKKKNKGRKSLTAVGAVVAAGLTPGIVTGTPASLPPNPDVEITAADVISIDGLTFDFDELFAMQQINRDQRDMPKLYGPLPVSVKEKEEQALREAARLDSIRRAQEARALVYGPPPPRYRGVGPTELRSIAARDKQEAANLVLGALMDYCAQMPNPNADGAIYLSENHDLVRELQMDHAQLEMLQQEIADRFEVQLTEEMLKQLGTLSRVANFIAEVAAPIAKE